MPESDVFRHLVGALSRFFVAGATVEETLLAVSQLATEAIPGADFAGMSLWDGDRVATRAYTDVESPELDAAQYESGAGPCLDAFRLGEVFRIDDMSVDDRWPAFATRCIDHGINATLSMPLVTQENPVGALNMYSRTPAAFVGDAPVAAVFAEMAATVIANAQAYWDAHQLSQDLAEAMSSRATIEQAKGILMAQSRVDADDAFELLVRASQRENRKLRDIAADIVTGTQP